MTEEEERKNSDNNHKSFGIRNIVACVKNEKKYLIKTIASITFFSLGVTSLILAFDIMLQLSHQEWSNKISPEQTSKLVDLGSELIFAILFIPVGIKLLRPIFSRFREIAKKETSEPEIKDSVKNVQKQSPAYKIFFYVVFLPFTYALLIIFGQNILQIVNSYFETTFLQFGNYVPYLMLVYIALINKLYVQPLRRVDVEKQFAMLGYEYIVKERRILKKIQKIGFVMIVVFSSILILYGFTNPNARNISINEVDVYAVLLLAISFEAMIMTGIASVKMNVDDAKKQFRAYVAASFLQEALEATKDKLRIDYLNYGLQSYDIFFKKTHRQKIKNIQQIIIEILSENDPARTTMIKNIIESLKSSNNYDALGVLAKIMNVNSHELLTPNTFDTQIKDWGLLIATVVITVFTVLLFLKGG